jgi:hypothetical protein
MTSTPPCHRNTTRRNMCTNVLGTALAWCGTAHRNCPVLEGTQIEANPVM